MSKLFRNVPFLTSLEMSPFPVKWFVGCDPERSPAPLFLRRQGEAQGSTPTSAAGAGRGQAGFMFLYVCLHG